MYLYTNRLIFTSNIKKKFYDAIFLRNTYNVLLRESFTYFIYVRSTQKKTLSFDSPWTHQNQLRNKSRYFISLCVLTVLITSNLYLTQFKVGFLKYIFTAWGGMSGYFYKKKWSIIMINHDMLIVIERFFSRESESVLLYWLKSVKLSKVCFGLSINLSYRKMSHCIISSSHIIGHVRDQEKHFSHW